MQRIVRALIIATLAVPVSACALDSKDDSARDEPSPPGSAALMSTPSARSADGCNVTLCYCADSRYSGGPTCAISRNCTQDSVPACKSLIQQYCAPDVDPTQLGIIGYSCEGGWE